MRLDLSLLVGGFFAISGGTAFSQTQSPFAVEMLTNELSYMSPSDIADCWLLTKIYGESVPVFEKQAATWEKIFLQKAETGLINLPDLIKNSEVVQHSGDGAVELKGKPSEMKVVVKSCMQKMLTATQRGLTELASRHGVPK